MPPANAIWPARTYTGQASSHSTGQRLGNKPFARPGRFPERFRANRCLFINVPGCEGSTIHRALFGGWDPGHVALRWYEQAFPRQYAASFKFAFVRDPAERAYVAWARWMEARLFASAENGDSLELDESFDSFVDQWLRPEHIQGHVDFSPQADFLLDRQGEFKLDFFGRYESLGRDFASLRDFLCIGTSLPWSAPAYERTPGARYPVSAWARRRLKQVYAQDYDLLGYS